jgi:threonine dehydrogenase-like Zn-dependent dehydrogenase
MHAVRHHSFGPPDVLVLDELPDLEPGAGQVRVAVRASGVHLLDTTLRRGESGGPMPLPELPTVPGREVAGVVDAVGEGVDPAWVGRRVVAHLGMVPGGYAAAGRGGARALGGRRPRLAARLLGGDPDRAGHRRPGLPRDHRRLEPRPSDDRAARRHPGPGRRALGKVVLLGGPR